VDRGGAARRASTCRPCGKACSPRHASGIPPRGTRATSSALSLRRGGEAKEQQRRNNNRRKRSPKRRTYHRPALHPGRTHGQLVGAWRQNSILLVSAEAATLVLTSVTTELYAGYAVRMDDEKAGKNLTKHRHLRIFDARYSTVDCRKRYRESADPMASARSTAEFTPLSTLGGATIADYQRKESKWPRNETYRARDG